MTAISDLPRRIASKIAVNPDSCWEWTAAKNRQGYGMVGFKGSMKLAHRVVYLLLVGPIPDGLEADHLCRVRHCVNPTHLEIVTHRVNSLRGMAPAVVAHRTNRCMAGLHDLAGDNVYLDRMGWRRCRECRRLAWNAWYARRKANT